MHSALLEPPQPLVMSLQLAGHTDTPKKGREKCDRAQLDTLHTVSVSNYNL